MSVPKIEETSYLSYQIISQKLHYQGGVLVALFTQGIKFYKEFVNDSSSEGNTLLTGDCIVECLLGEMAGLIGRVQDLVVEDREVQSETKTDRMSWCKVGSGNLGGSFVGLQ